MDVENIQRFLENAGCGSLSLGAETIIFRPTKCPLASEEFMKYMNDFEMDKDVALQWLANVKDAKSGFRH